MNPRPLVLLGGGAGDEVAYSLQSIVWASETLTEMTIGHEVRLVDRPEQLETITDAASDYLLLFHGGWGEGGEAQRLLERAACRFSGSRRDAAATCLDKLAAKAVAARIGIRTPRVYRREELDRCIDGRCDPVALRKPRYGGSSIGIELLDRAACVRIGDDRWCGDDYLEEFVSGVPASVTIVHTASRFEVLPPMAIRPHDELIYGYDTKTRSARDYLALSAVFPPPVCAAATAAATQVHHAIGCRGVTRTDFVIDPGGVPHFLEINNIPGLGETSNLLFAYLLAGRSGHAVIGDLLETIE